MSSSVGSQHGTDTTQPRRGFALASRPLMAYRTVDLVSAAMLGVAFGVVFWAWGKLYEPLSNA
ncbi:MAG: ECF transporter S component, partial [Actinomycetes bacterium]